MSSSIIQKQTIAIGLSGGVDSSVAAYLCKKEGHHVFGIHMQNWDENDAHCPQTQDWIDVQNVANQLGIDVHRVNFQQEYWNDVFESFLSELKKGRTPNPDILCNRYIKFEYGLRAAKNLGADCFATGHYARIGTPKNGMHTHLYKCLDESKDQTYFLSGLTEEQLRNAHFPLADFKKTEVRKLANDLGLITASKPDSTGICFIGERKFNQFISEYLLDKPGIIRDESGQILGSHRGLMYHTIGQRKGLNIGGQREKSGHAWYVVHKNIESNELTVVQGNNHPALFSRSLICSKIHWIHKPNLKESLKAKIRHQQPDQECSLTLFDDDRARVQFSQPQRAITPGQYIVFYEGDECLGSAVIEESQCE